MSFQQKQATLFFICFTHRRFEIKFEYGYSKQLLKKKQERKIPGLIYPVKNNGKT